ncbi:MAG TPA: nucleotide sugar dehydrogenase [Candidatus Binatia bacterium]|nr:nucleotide sugar dehydrogenase [Candidatus Binatia bacterium]
MWERNIAILGGCGHVGLPLGIAFADRGQQVVLYDTNPAAVEQVNRGCMPFRERGAEELLPRLVSAGWLSASLEAACLSSVEVVVVVVGTPVDRYLNPDIGAVLRAVDSAAPHLVGGQLLVLRSTIYPGVTALVEKRVAELGLTIDVAFCPERIAEGHALDELSSLPQIVSGRTPTAIERAGRLFRLLTPDIVELLPEEAELAKLFTNTWRYIKFATANQLFMIANDWGLDFERIRHAVTHRYPRAADMPGPGFAAGPCLFKDTMQIAAFNENQFTLGNASVMINEGLPLYLVSRLERRYDLSETVVGILGMAFKGGSDDTRSSLSYKLKRLLQIKAKAVLCTDPHVTTDPDLVPLQEVLERADLLVVATPHPEYARLEVGLPAVDLFNILGRGVRV